MQRLLTEPRARTDPSEKRRTTIGLSSITKNWACAPTDTVPSQCVDTSANARLERFRENRLGSPFRDLNDSAACNLLLATTVVPAPPESYRNVGTESRIRQFQAAEGSDSGELAFGTQQLPIKFGTRHDNSPSAPIVVTCTARIFGVLATSNPVAPTGNQAAVRQQWLFVIKLVACAPEIIALIRSEERKQPRDVRD
jgi:hypothetical protein